jgi:hypothetical protein
MKNLYNLNNIAKVRKISKLKLGNYDCRKYHSSIMSLIGGAREINRTAVDCS